MKLIISLTSLPILAAATAFLAVPQGNATPVPVPNFSFESPVLGNNSDSLGAGNTFPTGQGFQTGTHGQAEGIENPSGKFTGDNAVPGTLAAPADGVNAAFINTGAAATLALPNQGTGTIVSSASLATVALGETYTLTVAVGNPLGGGGSTQFAGSFTIGLLVNGTLATTFTLTNGETSITDGTFQDFNTNFTVGAGQAGGALTVQLLHQNTGPNGNAQLFFDNVRVDVVPEPSTVVMMLGGLASLILVHRSRRSARA